jgi:hypothetical protein
VHHFVAKNGMDMEAVYQQLNERSQVFMQVLLRILGVPD